MYSGTDYVLIASISGRALAQSARRGGWKPVVLDVFCDADTEAIADRCERIRMHQGEFVVDDLLTRMQRICHEVKPFGCVYGTGFESAPNLLDQLGQCAHVYGNSAHTLKSINDPRIFFKRLDESGIPHPAVRFKPPAMEAGWLMKKQAASGGGHIYRWNKHSIHHPRHYYQRETSGQVCSALFLADGLKVQLIGFNTLWTDARNSQFPCLYGGAINRANLTSYQQAKVEAYVHILVRTFALRGLNSLDFVVEGQMAPKVLEVNARPSASFDLYDADVEGGGLIRHIQACRGCLTGARLWQNSVVRAHAVVYAPGKSSIPSDLVWPVWSCDRPRPGNSIDPGQPVCTVRAEGKTPSEVMRCVRARHANILSRLKLQRQAA